MMQKAYGTWPSPLTAELVAAQGVRLSSVAMDGDDVYWIEGRPNEGGRNVIVRRRSDGTRADMIPAGFNARTRVHEYGGGASVVGRGEVYFSNFADQRIYRAAPIPEPITPEGAWFYADATLRPDGTALVCVREDHTGADAEPVNALVLVRTDATGVDVIASGYDFYATPRFSPDGSRLAWICWRHPRMPWDGTELWVADVAADGTLTNPVRVAGGPSEQAPPSSIYQPGWSPDGVLYFASDSDGWWRLYRQRVDSSGDAVIEPVLPHPVEGAEFGRPQWVFGTATWAFASPDRLVVSYTKDGHWRLATIDVDTGTLADVHSDWEPHEWLTATGGSAVLIAGAPTSLDAVIRLDATTHAIDVLRRAPDSSLDPEQVSMPESIWFPTTDDRTAHAFYYAPRNDPWRGLGDECPPLIVVTHGGPTTAATATLDLRIQYWTTRGFAVADVNYGGSSGFGRAYRARLDGQWGIVDVDDVVHAARHLVAEWKADPNRLAIRGGSAGGYTTLAALTFRPDVFDAGASYYGVSDLEVLARDTHKFESRYLDRLVGPYPEQADAYRARSPIHFVDRLSCALILFQGLEDKVVPPNQSQMMADAARAKGCPVAYLTFAGEQHGFRQAATIVRCLEAELYFYGAVFGFIPADTIVPITIDNL